MAEGDGMEGAAGGVASRTVFLSYASHDTEIANTVCRELESRGIRSWIAPRDVAPGALYADAIVRAINEAKVLLIVLSQSAVASSHVGREVERAASKRKQIIAFRVDAATLSSELEYFLSNSQWIDVAALGMPAALTKLADAVSGDSTPSSTANPTYKAATTQVDKPFGVVSKRIAMAAAATVVVVAAATLAVRFWPSKRSEAPAMAISDKSIAVLPFADLSEKHDQEYFSEGIAEEVLDRLTKVPALKVVGRASSFQFKGKNADSASIGTALGVAYLLEGSVRKESERIRVSAQLIEARTGAARWSDHFDSDVIDVLGVQDSIAIEITRALQIAVQADTAHRTSVKSPEVLDAYLRGLQSENRNTRESLESAVANFQQALILDPTFSPAAIGIAKTYAFIGAQGWLPTRIAFERAREAALLAQRLDPKSASPHVSMAQILIVYDWDWEGADRELQTAFALGPRDTYTVQTASWLAAARGQWEEARHLAIEAVELDPLDPTAHIILAWYVYLHTGQFAEAEQSVRRGLQIAPKWGTGQYVLGQTLLLQGQHEAALTEFRKETLNDGQLEGSAMAYYAARHKTESDAQLVEAIRHNGEYWPSEIARVYAFRGEKDHAFEWLDRAYQARDQDLYLIKGDPLLKNLEGDPRHKALLRKMNLPE
jgi:TolB-like protein